jgi:hypothetical protein
MRAAAKKSNINIVAVNDPFIPVNYSEFLYIYIMIFNEIVVVSSIFLGIQYLPSISAD